VSESQVSRRANNSIDQPVFNVPGGTIADRLINDLAPSF
jgi:hypothetical protein